MQLSKGIVESLRRPGVALGSASAIEYGLQLLLPVVLVRVLSTSDFGEYRVVWLLAATCLAIFPLFVPQSLFYFLPRNSAEDRKIVLANSLAFMIGVGVLGGTAFLAFGSLLPAAVQNLEVAPGVVPIFLAVWIFSSILDVLLVADGRPLLQAKAIIAVAALRTVLIASTAAITEDVRYVLYSMCAFGMLKALLVLIYFRQYAGLGITQFRFGRLKDQLAYAAPFAIGNTFFLLRAQADQWIVAEISGVTSFALISIAVVMPGAISFIKSSVFNSVLPRVSALVGNSQMDSARKEIGETYRRISLLVVPVLGLLFVCAEDVVRLVYTSAYLDVVPLMRVYLAGQLVTVISAGYFLPVLGKGRASMVINAAGLVLSVVACIVAVNSFGLIGAAIGSVSALLLGEVATLLVAARVLKCRPFEMVCFSFSLRVVAVALISASLSMMTAQVWTSEYVFIRLFLAVATYALVLSAFAVVLGVHGSFRQLIAVRGAGFLGRVT